MNKIPEVQERFFPNDNESSKTVQILRGGVKQPFWELLTRILDIEIATLEADILDNEHTPEDESKLKSNRSMMKELRNLPETLITTYTETPIVQKTVNPDPYENKDDLNSDDN